MIILSIFQNEIHIKALNFEELHLEKYKTILIIIIVSIIEEIIYCILFI